MCYHHVNVSYAIHVHFDHQKLLIYHISLRASRFIKSIVVINNNTCGVTNARVCDDLIHVDSGLSRPIEPMACVPPPNTRTRGVRSYLLSWPDGYIQAPCGPRFWPIKTLSGVCEYEHGNLELIRTTYPWWTQLLISSKWSEPNAWASWSSSWLPRVSRPILTTFVLLHGNVTDMFQGMWRLWGHEEMCIISKRPPETLIMGDQCIKVRSQQHINKKSQLLTGGK